MSVRSDREKRVADDKLKAAHTKLLEAQARQLEMGRGVSGGMAYDTSAPIPQTQIARTKQALEGQREKLLETLTRVEKALHIINSDSRVRELNDLLLELGI